MVCHSGHGPHSGHYFANVRAGNGKWFVMNDSSTHEVPASGACNQRNAYLLFYERTNRLDEAVGRVKVPAPMPNGVGQTVTSGNPTFTGKRKEREEDDNEADTSQSFPQQKIKTNSQINGVEAGRKSPMSSPNGVKKHSSPAWAGFSQLNGMPHTPPSSPPPKSSLMSLGPRPASVLQQQQLQRKSSSSYPPLATKQFFGNNKDGRKERHKNRPKLVTSMVGRPR